VDTYSMGRGPPGVEAPPAHSLDGRRSLTSGRGTNSRAGIGYVKDYDAIVAVCLDNHEHCFAREEERTPKAKSHYHAIRKRIEAETEFRHFLYLTRNHDMLSLLLREFECCHRPVHFGLRNDFLADTISLPVQTNHSPISTTFRVPC
jgi:hypothetical protein